MSTFTSFAEAAEALGVSRNALLRYVARLYPEATPDNTYAINPTEDDIEAMRADCD